MYSQWNTVAQAWKRHITLKRLRVRNVEWVTLILVDQSKFRSCALNQKTVKPEYRRLLTKNSKCWNYITLILLDWSANCTWTLSQMIVSPMDRSNPRADQSIPNTKMILIQDHMKHTKMISNEHTMIQQWWEAWESHTYLLIIELKIIHIDKRMSQKKEAIRVKNLTYLSYA